MQDLPSSLVCVACGNSLSCGMYVGSSSLTEDQTWAPCIGVWVLATALPGKSLAALFWIVQFTQIFNYYLILACRHESIDTFSRLCDHEWDTPLVTIYFPWYNMWSWLKKIHKNSNLYSYIIMQLISCGCCLFRHWSVTILCSCLFLYPFAAYVVQDYRCLLVLF